jgi:enamine deaminase RidA (YjgF/YER057c/UK114 family)
MFDRPQNEGQNALTLTGSYSHLQKGVTPMKKVNCIALAFVAILLLSAQHASGQKARHYINLPNRPVQAPFSDGVLIGDTLFIAGRIGLDPTTGKPPDDLEQEIKILLDGVKSVLKEAGMTMDDLASVQVFCPDVSLYDKFNSVYRGYFGKEYPARAFVGSGPLLRGGHFEMLGIAVKAPSRSATPEHKPPLPPR